MTRTEESGRLQGTGSWSPCCAVVSALLAIFAAVACGPAETTSEKSGGSSEVGVSPRPGSPVVLISIDTLRSDRLPAYGYRDGFTPNLDRLVADGVLFEHAYTHSPLTLPAHASVMTGLLPYEHGVRNNLGYRFRAGSHDTLSELLSAAGYSTGAAVSSYVLREATGIATGFDFYDDGVTVRERQPLGRLERPGTASLAAASSWLRSRGRAPFLFWLHLFEPHAPYVVHDSASTAHPYDQEISAADAVVGQLIELLESLGVYDEALFVVLSDHGEGLGDHGESEHGIFLYRETVQVPLIWKLPGAQFAGGRITETAQLVDVMPTVLDIVGVPKPVGLAGRSLRFDGQATGPPRDLYAETLYPRLHLGWSELRSVIEFPLQLIEAPRAELFDLLRDPRQETNLIARGVDENERRGLRRLQAHLARHRSAEQAVGDSVGVSSVDHEDRRRLEALGYVGSGDSRDSGDDPKDRIVDLERLREAFSLEAEGDLDTAARVLEALLDASPDLLDGYTKLAQIYRDLGEPERSLDTRRRAIEVQPDLATLQLVEIGALHLELGQLQEARRHAEAASDLEPDVATLLLARVALREGDLRAARSLAEPLLNRAPVYYGAVLVVGESLALAGELDAALELVEQAAVRAVDRKEAPIEALELLRGDSLARLGRHEEARGAFEAEIEWFPRRLESYSRLAVLLAVEGRRDESLGVLERMVHTIGSPAAYGAAARTAATLGFEREAAGWRERAAGG